MMSKNTLIVLLSTLFGNLTFGQQVFTKSFTYLTDYRSVYPLPDKGFLLGGNDAYSSGTNMSMVKTDSRGTVQWAKSYGDGASSYEEATEAIQTLDNNFLLIGSNPYGTGYVYVVKTDTIGNMLWHKSYQLISAINTNQYVNDCIELPDSGIVIVGSAGSYGLLMKIDSNGNLIWTSNLFGTGSTSITKILRMQGGDCLITGSDNNQFFIARIDPVGTVIWSKNYSNMGTTGQNSCATVDGNYVFTGTPVSGLNILKIDPAGNAIWGKSYNTTTSYGCAIAEQSNKDLFITFYQNSAMRVMKTDSLGNLPVCKYGSGGNIEIGRNMRPSGDGSYVMVSSNYLFKVNALPTICMSNTQLVAATSIIPVASSLAFSVNNYSGIVFKNIFSFSIPVSGTTVCGGKCLASDNFSIAMDFPDTICQGASVNMTASVTSSSGSPTYIWYEDGIPFSTLTNPVRNYNVPGLHRIMLIVKNPASCRDTTYKNIYVRGDCGTNGTPVPYYNLAYTNFSNPGDIKQTSDSGFAIAGRAIVSGLGDMCLMKTDSVGNVLWGKTYGDPAINEIAGFVKVMPDKGYLIAGDDNYIFVVRTDSVGNLLWGNNYKPATLVSTTSSILKDVQITPDSGAILVGRNGGSGNNGMMFKIDKNGNVVWTQHKNACYFTSICAIPNNEYLVCGTYLAAGPCIFKIDGTGAVIWAKHYTGMNFESIYDILPVSDGNYMVLVNYSSTGLLLMKIDPDGNIIWSTKEDGFGAIDGTNTTAIENTDNGFDLVVHSSSSLGLSIIKTTALGRGIESTYNTGSNIISPLIRTYDGACVFLEGSNLHKFTSMNTIKQCVNTNISNTHTGVPPTIPASINPATNTYCIAIPQIIVANPSVHTSTIICTNIGCNADASFNAPIFACTNQTVAFTNTSIGGTSFIWKINNVPFSTAFDTSYTFTTTGTFAIRLDLTDSSGCTDNYILNIVVSATPVVTYTQSPSIFCDNPPIITLTPGIPAGGIYSGPGVSGNTFDPTAVGVGTYQLIYTYTSSAGCQNSDTSLVSVTVCTQIQNNSDTIHFARIFPNPSTGIFMLNSEIKKGDIEIYNMLGEKIFSEKFNDFETKIDLNGRANGIYFITVKSETESFTQKIIINH